MDPADRTRRLKSEARALGFQRVGVAAVDGPADPEGRLQAWLDQGYHGSMGYMARTAAERADVRAIMPNARSVVAVALSYYRPEHQPRAPLKVSRYAVGRDYHNLMRRRLRRLRKKVLELCPDAAVKPTVDTSPVLEREWARRAGVGWIGKSTMSIAPDLGTYYFLGTLVTSAELEPDHPHPDRCGSCTRCLDACPTSAFVGPGQLDARRCITHWNVEERHAAAEALPDLHQWLAGCDVCQEVCPWNKFARATEEPHFAPRPQLARPDLETFLRDGEAVAQIIEGTALARTGADALMRNARRIAARDSAASSTLRGSDEDR